jgi:hypothetical protein
MICTVVFVMRTSASDTAGDRPSTASTMLAEDSMLSDNEDDDTDRDDGGKSTCGLPPIDMRSPSSSVNGALNGDDSHELAM